MLFIPNFVSHNEQAKQKYMPALRLQSFIYDDYSEYSGHGHGHCSCQAEFSPLTHFLHISR